MGKQNDNRAEIIKIMKTLSSSNGAEKKIPELATDIMIMADLGAVNDLPMAQKNSTKATIAELQKLQKKAIALHKHISGMHKDAVSAIPSLVLFSSDLKDTVLACDESIQRFEGGEQTKGSTKPSKRQAREVANRLARCYQTLTDKKPTVSTRTSGDSGPKAYGPFLEFVTDMFMALDIDARPERFSRVAAKDFSSLKKG